MATRPTKKNASNPRPRLPFFCVLLIMLTTAPQLCQASVSISHSFVPAPSSSRKAATDGRPLNRYNSNPGAVAPLAFPRSRLTLGARVWDESKTWTLGGSESESEGGRVDLKEGKGGARLTSTPVRRTLPISPSAAKELWLSYVWDRNGGLPFVPVWKKRGRDDVRIVGPFMVEETLYLDNDEHGDGDENDDGDEDEDEILTVRYAVTNFGPLLSSEFVAGSHSATVKFAPAADEGGGGECCELTWEGGFETVRRQDFWRKVGESATVQTVDNLVDACGTPRLLVRKMRLGGGGGGEDRLTTEEAMEEWIRFIWKEGGGLPLVTRVPWPLFGGSNDLPLSSILIPPGVRETLVSAGGVDGDGGSHELTYRMDTLGYFGYQAHTHRGRVRFLPVRDDDESSSGGGGGDVEMVWEVEVRPYKYFGPFLESLTEAVVTTASRNLRVRIEEPGAKVDVSPPRGKGDAFYSVPKETWLGGVLQAHLTDRRATIEQTWSLFRPWTWGRSEDEREGDTCDWTDGYFPP